MGFDIDNYLERSYNGELLEELVIKLICLKLKEIFINEPNVKYLKAPVTVVGDVHGFLLLIFPYILITFLVNFLMLRNFSTLGGMCHILIIYFLGIMWIEVYLLRKYKKNQKIFYFK